MILVEEPGLLTMVQDRGRPGWQHLGVSPGGAMDPFSALIGQALVGNALGTAGLEITLAGPRLRFARGTWAALTGADLSAHLDEIPMPLWRPVWVPAGARLRFGHPRLGCRAYLAVAGGFKLKAVLGSQATDCRAGFGGLAGRALRGGDCLELAATDLPAPKPDRRMRAPTWWVNGQAALHPEPPVRLRLIVSPDWHRLAERDRRALEAARYRIGQRSDRMGLRLEGPALNLAGAGERLSAGVAFGTLQLPPNGQPILLGVDRQTTGGYPVLGTVASVDHPRLAQLRPGDAVGFAPMTVERAQHLYRLGAHRLGALLTGLAPRWPLNRGSSPWDASWI